MNIFIYMRWNPEARQHGKDEIPYSERIKHKHFSNNMVINPLIKLRLKLISNRNAFKIQNHYAVYRVQEFCKNNFQVSIVSMSFLIL